MWHCSYISSHAFQHELWIERLYPSHESGLFRPTLSRWAMHLILNILFACNLAPKLPLATDSILCGTGRSLQTRYRPSTCLMYALTCLVWYIQVASCLVVASYSPSKVVVMVAGPAGYHPVDGEALRYFRHKGEGSRVGSVKIESTGITSWWMPRFGSGCVCYPVTGGQKSFD